MRNEVRTAFSSTLTIVNTGDYMAMYIGMKEKFRFLSLFFSKEIKH
jgi:hypothetical protein